MIEYNKDESSNLAEFTVKGTFSKEEYHKIAEDFKKDTQNWESINILESIEDLQGQEVSGFLEDLKFFFKNLNLVKKIDKCAIVSDEKWVQTLSSAIDALISAKVQGFYSNQKDEARQWLVN